MVKVTQQELKEIIDLERDVAPKVKRIEELKSNVKALLIHKMPVELGLRRAPHSQAWSARALATRLHRPPRDGSRRGLQEAVSSAGALRRDGRGARRAAALERRPGSG